MKTSIELLPFTPPNDGAALYRQVAQWVKTNIRMGKLAPGEKLPTVRALAGILEINRGAVASAYSHLIREGTLVARVGRGTFAAAERNQTAETPQALTPFWDPILLKSDNRTHFTNREGSEIQAADAVWVPDHGKASSELVHFPVDVPLADHALSYSLVCGALNDMAKNLNKRALSYSYPQGLYELRQCLANLAQKKAITITPQEVMITNGAQEAFSLVAALLVKPGDVVITEDPTYPGAVKAFKWFHANVVGIPLDDEGMRVDLLEDALSTYHPVLIYTIPSFQAPTGITQSDERRRQIYALAAKHHVPILEDEYVNDIYYGEPPPNPIKSLDVEQLVIYVGTFSKSLGAGMRLGWVATHPDIIARLAQIKEMRDIHSSIFSQLVVEQLLRDGSYTNLLSELRKHYNARFRAMRTYLQEMMHMRFPQHKYAGGFSLWTNLPAGLSSRDWLVYARTRGVPFEDGSTYFLKPERGHYAKFCFSLLSMEEIRQAVELLRLSLRDYIHFRRRIQSDRRDRFLPFV